MTKQNTFKHLGTTLMVIPVLLLSYVYLPIIRAYIAPPEVVADTQASYSLFIPSIKASAPIVTEVDPWNEDEYQEKLQEGVAHAKGTSIPGEKGTVYLFAHSSDLPWRITQYNTAFYRIHELSQGDEIIIYKNGEEIKYEVSEKRTINPSQVEYLTEDQGDVLILQTCTPIGTDWNRLLVFAKPKV